MEETKGLSSSIIKMSPILTNSDKCDLGWYRTDVFQEGIPTKNNWYFPTFGYGMDPLLTTTECRKQLSQ